MNLLKKIFPLSAIFSGNTKMLVLGLLIYFALSFVVIPLMFIPVVGLVVNYYILFGTVLTILFAFGAFDENDDTKAAVKKIFYFSYKLTDSKENFIKGIVGYVGAILFVSPLSAYSVIGLVLLIVDYCKKNKAAKVEATADAE